MWYQLSSETELSSAAFVASDVTGLKVLTFEQEAQHFHFALSPTNSVASSIQSPQMSENREEKQQAQSFTHWVSCLGVGAVLWKHKYGKAQL